VIYRVWVFCFGVEIDSENAEVLPHHSQLFQEVHEKKRKEGPKKKSLRAVSPSGEGIGGTLEKKSPKNRH
jgi:hypothetical protein